MISQSSRWLGIALLTAAAPNVAAASSEAAETAAREINALADRYYAWLLRRSPEIAYFSGVAIKRHDEIFDNSPAARRHAILEEDAVFEAIRSIDSALVAGKTEWITHAYLQQELGAEIDKRVCRNDLWNVNQMGGWHLGYTQIAQLQPIGTNELRQQALARWSKLPAFIEQEIANLQNGLQQGYSAPKSVVQRVLDQVDGLLELPLEESPFYSAASRDGDTDFAAALRGLLADHIYPALTNYRDFLAGTYLEESRDELSVTANPNGRACYEASLHAYTTLDRSGEEVYKLGEHTVNANRAHVVKLGLTAYDLEDFSSIMMAAKSDPEDRFATADELLEFSRNMVRRAADEMPGWVGNMPAQAVSVVPFPEHEEGTGRSAHYRPGNAERPAEYRIPLYEPGEQSRGNAEATAFHEAWPGHHLQVATLQAVEGMHPLTRVIWFSGPGEGWARYSESLAEEMGLYATVTGPILRRAWPARGMVVDPGIHLFGWSRQQAAEYMNEAGRFAPSQADEMVDRIAILPGQLTAYDSGGLEIFALRRQAEEALGEKFDIREFHDQVLENGTIPLTQLRQHVEAWINWRKMQPR